jgi:murein DD-endopeptidase MepM/ murein hydrolase activator NlpD
VSGSVVQKQGPIGGFQVTLSGVDGVIYLNSHLDSFGESGNVSAGDVIGYVGSTGNAMGTRPHVHFGMYDGGAWVNPYPTLVDNGC